MVAHALINVGPGGVMEAGLATARHKESVPFWHDGENVAFRNLGVEKAVGAEDLLLVGRKVLRIAQAYVDGSKRIYFQTDDFSIFGWNGSGFPYFISNPGRLTDLVPFGNWLFVAAAGLSVWQNSGGIVPTTAGGNNIKLAQLFKKHLICFTENQAIWPDIRNPLDFTRARNRTANRIDFRDLGSAILCVRPLGQGLGVYTADALRVIHYNGASFWFGERDEPINGIGAIGPNSVCEAGFKNYGLTRNGIFITDGNSFQYIDTPAFHGYLEDDLDWSRQDEVFSWHNEAFQEVVFHYPAMDGTQKALAYKYTNGGFTKYRLPIYAAAQRDVFSYPLLGTANGLAYAKGTAAATCFVRTKPLDAGDSLRYKYFDYFRLIGEFGPDANMRLGVNDVVNSEPEWIYSGPMVSETWIEREAVFLTMEFSTNLFSSFQISQILVSGKITGRIF